MAIFTVDKFRAKDVGARADYFEKGEELEAGPQYTSGEEDYFLDSRDTILSEIVGGGSVALGLGSNPEPGDYKLLFNGFNPRTGESFVSDTRRGQLDKDPKANAGFSTSFNVDKSISLLYASSPAEIQQHFEKAMMEAARRSIEQAEKRGIIGTRAVAQGESEKAMEDATGQIVSLNYLHFTNRAQEPHLHVHCEIPNLVIGEDGKWRTINARELYARQTEMAAMFDGYLYQALQRDCPEISRLLAVDFERSGLIAPCVSPELIKQFSSRREEIKETMREEGLAGQDAARGVAKRTRPEKELIDPEELRKRWKEEIGDIHHEPGDLTPATKLMVEQLLFRSGSVFKERDLDRAAMQLSICHGGPNDMPAIKSAICRQLGVIKLPEFEGGDGKKAQLYTSESFRQMEVDLLRFALKARAPAERFALTDAALTAAVAQVEQEKGFALRDEQRVAFIHAAGGAQLSIIEGAAGTGKSQTLAALRVGYEAAGHRVLGLAPSGAAAAELEKSSGIESRTIHALLMRLENDNPQKREVLSATDVLVVDEAGMVDTRTMHKLLGFAEAAGAKVVLTGDSKQLESVGSASTFQMLGEQLGAARLEQIARQRNPDDRAISQAWFAGGDAVGQMEARGLLRAEGEGTPTAINMMLRDAAQTHAAGTDWREILLLADRNAQVGELNRRVREHRKELGELDADAEKRIETTSDRGYSRSLDVAPGDRLMLRRNALLGEAQVYNGDRATLLGIERIQTGEDKDGQPIFDHRLTVQLDRNGETLAWNLSEYDRIDHAYAMTVHKSQGLTVDHAFYLASEMSDRRSSYVAFTRSREACPFYLDASTAKVFADNTGEFSAKLTALDADSATKSSVLAELPHPASVRVIEQEQPTTKALLEKSGDRFEYPSEPPAPAKASPEIIVIPPGQGDAVLANARGYAVTELIDRPDDTRRRPGKPYERPAGADRIALQAEYLPPLPELKPEAHQAKEAAHEKARTDHERNQPGRPAAANPRQLDAGAERPAERDGRATGEPAGSPFGRYQLAPGAEFRAGDPSQYTEHRAPGPGQPDPFDAFRPAAAHDLQRLLGSRLDAGREGGTEGLLPPHVQVCGGDAARLRREADRSASDAVERSVEGRRMAKQYDKAADEQEKREIRSRVSVEMVAQDLGYERVRGASSRVKFRDSRRDKDDPMREIVLSNRGDGSWISSKSYQQKGLGGDVFNLRMKATGESFADAHRALYRMASGREPERSAGASRSARQTAQQPQMSDAERAAKAAAAREANRLAAHAQYQAAVRRPNAFLESRGISPETLANTYWRTDRRDNAIFVHEDAAGRFAGFEKKSRGFGQFSASERGIYVANGKVEQAREIRVSEGGLDALSAYQLASRAEQRSVLFASTGGNPAHDNLAALVGLAERRQVTQISLAYDHDKAGDAHTATMRDLLAQHAPHLTVRDVRREMGLEQGEDPNDLLQRRQRELAAEMSQQRRPAEQEQAAQPTPAPTAAERPAPVPAPSADKPGAETEQEPAKPAWTPAPVPQQPEQDQENDYYNGMER